MNIIKKNKIVVLLCAVALIVAVGLFITYSGGTTLQTVRIQQVFADVDGNGSLDLIISADVVLNPMTNTFLASVPSQ